ncbi:MAG TPA: YdeI/OmpD-associated family protein, partial [Candidatus Kapabacteria bacterium]|nr:YdeI/OmpD-associated family protein [Candidatus Kapabacteria bacterium]
MQKKFKAKLRPLDEINLGWKVVDIPFDVKKIFGSAGRVPVKGTANGFPFKTSLFPKADCQHFLMLNKQVQKGAGIDVGDKVDIILEADLGERTVEVPAILKKALSEEQSLWKYFNDFSYSMRKYIVDYTMEPKSDEAKQRRAEQMAVRLMETMDGEEVTPPLLEQYLVNNPKARKGWETMPRTHRRQHLFGIFGLVDPDARHRRIKKALDELIK